MGDHRVKSKRSNAAYAAHEKNMRGKISIEGTIAQTRSPWHLTHSNRPTTTRLLPVHLSSHDIIIKILHVRSKE